MERPGEVNLSHTDGEALIERLGPPAAHTGKFTVRDVATIICFDPGGFRENGSLKNKDFREQFVQGFVSRKTAIFHGEKEGKTHAKMSAAA